MIGEFETQTERETGQIARDFAGKLKPGDVVVLYGELGTGKTFFVKEICRELRCDSEATSPSFTLMNVYTTGEGVPVYHFDFYRIADRRELDNLGLDEFFYHQAFVFVEWPEIASHLLPGERYEVHLSFVKQNPSRRKIRIVQRQENGVG